MSIQTIAYAPATTHRIFLTGTSKGKFEESLGRGPLKRVEAKEFLFSEGDPVTHVYRIETGALALYRVLSDGRRQVMGFAYPGEIVGLGIDGSHTMNAQAVKPTRVRCVTTISLRHAAASDPELGLKLYEAMARELAATRDLMLTTGQRSACERVAAFVLALSRRNERSGHDPRVIELPMTRADIGDFLGLTIETVSRTFSKFKATKLVDLPRSNEVRILDVAQLRKLAEGH
jgi:CRP/FNR family transcriptional regulator